MEEEKSCLITKVYKVRPEPAIEKEQRFVVEYFWMKGWGSKQTHEE
jgi:hypothetical protein